MQAVFDEVITPDSSISVNSAFQSSSSSVQSITPTESVSSDSGIQADPLGFVFYERIHVPPEPNLRDLLVQAGRTNEIAQLTEIRLQVITVDVSLQHLSLYMPLLQELNLEGSIVTSLRDLGCGLRNLKILRVSRCCLISLDGMLGLQNLEELYADNNMIENISPCTNLTNIKVIDLRRNNIKDISYVSFLIICENLEHLSFEGNGMLTREESYRETIKRFLPNLKTLDGVAFSEEFEVMLNYGNNTGDYKDHDDSSKELHNQMEAPSTSGNQRVTSKCFHHDMVPFMVTFLPRVLSPRSTSAGSNASDSCISTGKFPNTATRP